MLDYGSYLSLNTEITEFFSLTLSHIIPFLATLQQTTFENIGANGYFAQDEQFLLLPQCFQLYSIITLSLVESFDIYTEMFENSSNADLLYVGNC